MRKFVRLAAFGGMVALCASQANAVTYSFFRIPSTNGNPDLSSQLSVDVTDGGSGTVDFQFFNDIGIASSIEGVYFADGSLLGIASISDSGSGVAFSEGATPGDLPGGASIDPKFLVTEEFLADSDAPPVENGVNTSAEWVTITFDLISGMTFQDTLDALDDGSLRIGIHVQGIQGQPGEDGSDSFVNVPIPAPGAALLAALGLGLVGWYRRRTA